MAREDRVREIEQVVTAHRQLEGGGFVVRRPFPGEIDSVDPFLLIDEMGPVDYAPGEAIGAPDHPHRGFETVTYVLEGEMEHEDSAGHRGKLGPGDVQWMTAGGGVVHSEMPSRRIREQGGRVHGFQVWLNLPRRDTLIRPRYQEYSREKLPQANTGDGKAQVRVIAGEALGAHAVIETRTPIVFQDWTLQPGADVTIPFTPDLRMLVYVFEGSVRIGPNGTTLEEGQLAGRGVTPPFLRDSSGAPPRPRTRSRGATRTTTGPSGRSNRGASATGPRPPRHAAGGTAARRRTSPPPRPWARTRTA